MSDKALRAAIIKLAYDNPKLREDLLPLIGVKEANVKKTANVVKFKTTSTMTIDPKNIVISLEPATTISPAVVVRLQRALLQRKLQVVLVDKILQIQVVGVEEEDGGEEIPVI
jgi:hypothetical protein